MNLFNLAKDVVGWASLPVKILLALFLVCLAASIPQITDLIGATAALSPALVWIRIATGFFGICFAVNVVWNSGRVFGPPIGKMGAEWAMDWKIGRLSADEIAVIKEHFGDQTRRHHLNKNSALVSLVEKGILVPSALQTGQWTDQLAYDLTPEANKSLRKRRIRRRLFSD